MLIVFICILLLLLGVLLILLTCFLLRRKTNNISVENSKSVAGNLSYCDEEIRCRDDSICEENRCVKQLGSNCNDLNECTMEAKYCVRNVVTNTKTCEVEAFGNLYQPPKETGCNTGLTLDYARNVCLKDNDTPCQKSIECHTGSCFEGLCKNKGNENDTCYNDTNCINTARCNKNFDMAQDDKFCHDDNYNLNLPLVPCTSDNNGCKCLVPKGRCQYKDVDTKQRNSICLPDHIETCEIPLYCSTVNGESRGICLEAFEEWPVAVKCNDEYSDPKFSFKSCVPPTRCSDRFGGEKGCSFIPNFGCLPGFECIFGTCGGGKCISSADTTMKLYRWNLIENNGFSRIRPDNLAETFTPKKYSNIKSAIVNNTICTIHKKSERYLTPPPNMWYQSNFFIQVGQRNTWNKIYFNIGTNTGYSNNNMAEVAVADISFYADDINLIPRLLITVNIDIPYSGASTKSTICFLVRVDDLISWNYSYVLDLDISKAFVRDEPLYLTDAYNGKFSGVLRESAFKYEDDHFETMFPDTTCRVYYGTCQADGKYLVVSDNYKSDILSYAIEKIKRYRNLVYYLENQRLHIGFVSGVFDEQNTNLNVIDFSLDNVGKLFYVDTLSVLKAFTTITLLEPNTPNIGDLFVDAKYIPFPIGIPDNYDQTETSTNNSYPDLKVILNHYYNSKFLSILSAVSSVQ